MPTGPLSRICLCSQNRPDDMVMAVVFGGTCSVAFLRGRNSVMFLLPSAFPIFPPTHPVMFSKCYRMIQICDYFLPSVAQYEAIIQQGSLSLRDLTGYESLWYTSDQKGFPSMAKWLTVVVIHWVCIQCVETNLTGIPHLFGKPIAFAASPLGSMTSQPWITYHM